MRTLWAVLQREVTERWQIVLLGLFLGVLCPVVAYLPLGFSSSPSEVRDGMVLAVSATFFGLMVLLLGLGLFASDQATGRSGFYLARPIRPWHLLVGRVVAALILVLVGASLVMLPSLALRRELPDSLDISPFDLGAALVGLALAIGHAVAVALRLRGRWTLFDVAALTATVLTAGSTLQKLQLYRVRGQISNLLENLAILVVVAAGCGIWAQLRYGGVQRGRLHAVFSLTFWLLVLSSTAGFEAKLRWDLAKDWDDVVSFAEVTVSSDGRAAWLSATEDLPRQLFFVMDLERGESIPVGPIFWLRRAPLVEGRTVLWLDCRLQEVARGRRPPTESCFFRYLDLDAAREPGDVPRPVDLGIARGSWEPNGPILLSPEGDRLAVADRKGTLSVYSLPAARPVLRAELPDLSRLLRFEADGSLVAIAGSGGELRFETVAPDGAVQRLDTEAWPREVGSPADVGAVTASDGARWLVDPEVDFPDLPPDLLLEVRARRLVGEWATWTQYETFELHALHRDGRRLEPIKIPRAKRLVQRSGEQRPGYPILQLGPELAPGRVLVIAGEVHRYRMGQTWGEHFDALGVYDETTWVTHLVDLDAGRITASFEGFRALTKRIETPSGPGAWLLDERRMPYRLDLARLDPRNPEAGLEPVFRPPWDHE